MRPTTIAALGAVLTALAACGAPGEDATDTNADPVGLDTAPNGRGGGTLRDPPASSKSPRHSSNGISYHGGPILLGTTNVYYIWYGNWSGNSATTILTDLANNLGGSSYWNINTTYTNGTGQRISNALHLAGSATDAYSHGTALGDNDVFAIVSDALTSNKLPTDANGVYFVLTSADVSETSGFCRTYCGWHTHGAYNSVDIKYAFVGNAAQCPSACEAQTTGPNGNAGADGMASVIAHEAEEAATDPDLNAWYDLRGNENADKCAWTFGTEYTASNGARANVRLGARDFLIQQNWVNAAGGYCAMGY